ncbi:MAG: single-stranded DNA-binding protein [Candidatus Hydrogenedentes bacterium]|nr:single-stranded DNA-binding protein [Candidatus Hydrogenedentota bacterium]
MDSLLSTTDALRREVSAMRFGSPVTHVYNPLDYARAPHEQYLRRYGQAPKEIVLVGMNPGPWGMAQTGVPFGEVRLVRDWLGIDAPVNHPDPEHPVRPITGFACARSEVSGARLWGWARARFHAPECFFKRFFIVNYCPLCFMESSGRNFTPDKLPAREREPLIAACDRALRDIITHFRPRYVIGVGHFAEARARAALTGMAPIIGRIPHPSPASPAANRGWAEAAETALTALGISV